MSNDLHKLEHVMRNTWYMQNAKRTTQVSMSIVKSWNNLEHSSLAIIFSQQFFQDIISRLFDSCNCCAKRLQKVVDNFSFAKYNFFWRIIMCVAFLLYLICVTSIFCVLIHTWKLRIAERWNMCHEINVYAQGSSGHCEGNSEM